MKNLKLLFFVVLALFVTACDKGNDTPEPEAYTIDFESVQLLATSSQYANILWGKPQAKDDGNGNNVYDGILYSEKGAGFGSYFNDFAGSAYPYDSWGGFAFSSNKVLDDTEDPMDYRNQFSAYATQASKFAIAFDMGGRNGGTYESPFISFDKEVSLLSARIANSNKGYHYCVKNPNGVDNFYFKLSITGYKGETETGKAEIELAANGTALADWKEVDLKVLGKVNKVKFSFDSNDSHPQYGINVPAFFCIDDIKFTVE